MNPGNPDDQTKWEIIENVSKTKLLVKNLEPGKVYWFHISALGTAGEGPLAIPQEEEHNKNKFGLHCANELTN